VDFSCDASLDDSHPQDEFYLIGIGSFSALSSNLLYFNYEAIERVQQCCILIIAAFVAKVPETII